MQFYGRFGLVLQLMPQTLVTAAKGHVIGEPIAGCEIDLAWRVLVEISSTEGELCRMLADCRGRNQAWIFRHPIEYWQARGTRRAKKISPTF